jgi:hypothetical protein
MASANRVNQAYDQKERGQGGRGEPAGMDAIRAWYRADKAYQANATEENNYRASLAFDAIPNQPGWDDFVVSMGDEDAPEPDFERLYEQHLDALQERRDGWQPREAR